jgi:ABC-type nitrate/sulfonate/bicarbonate transport system substrate-binding protein
VAGQSMMAQLLIVDKGLPFRVFTPFSLSDDFVIAARSDIKSLAQLKDPSTVVAADSPGGAGQTVINAMLKARDAGFLVADIPKVVIIESSGERTSALAGGDCDATVIHLVQAQSIEQEVGGLNILARLYGEVPDFMTYSYAAPQQWLDENLETAAAITASVIQSSRDLIKDYAAFDAAVKQLMEEPPKPAELRELFKVIQQNDIFPVDGGMTDKRTQFMIELGKSQGLIETDLTPDKVLDRRPMERAMEMLKA